MHTACRCRSRHHANKAELLYLRAVSACNKSLISAESSQSRAANFFHIVHLYTVRGLLQVEVEDNREQVENPPSSPIKIFSISRNHILSFPLPPKGWMAVHVMLDHVCESP